MLVSLGRVVGSSHASGKNKVAVGYLHKEVAKCRLITEYSLNMKSTCFRTHHQVGGAATGTGITRYNDSRVWGAGQVPGRTTDRPGHHAMPTRGQVLSHSTNFHRHFSVTIRTITIIRICCLNNVHNRRWWWWW